MSPETQARLVILRQKSVEGTITMEELREGVLLMRADRVAGASASDGSRRAKAKAVVKSADEMLDELGGL